MADGSPAVQRMPAVPEVRGLDVASLDDGARALGNREQLVGLSERRRDRLLDE